MTAAVTTPRAARADVAGRLRARIDVTLARLLRDTREVALLDFPNYDNPGDSAIWLGSLAALRRAGARPAYVAERRSFSRRGLPAGPALINGGGNLGDLWPVIQGHREQVVDSLGDRRVIQLPQTIHFETGEALARARAVFARHPDLLLLVRDERSLEIARDRLETRAELCPDMAFALGPIERPREGEGILWLARDDAEATARATPRKLPPGVTRLDWPSDRELGPARVAARRALKLYGRLAKHLPDAGRRPLERAYARVAADGVRRACHTLSGARVVVTDRLHGHILCLLMGIPHVLLDNSYGKLRGFHDTWTRDSNLVHRANAPGQALELASALLEDER